MASSLIRPHAVGGSVALFKAASTLDRMGFENAARQVRVSAVPDAAANNADPKTVGEALARLDDNLRSMLLRAAHGERDAIDQSVATLPLWWEVLPSALRSNIDFKIQRWIVDHPRSAARADHRRFQILQPSLRGPRNCVHRLGIAARLPA